MAAQQPVAQPAERRYVVGAWSLSRIFMFIAGVCLLIAALGAADVVTAVDWLPWVLGGASAMLFAWAVP